MARQPTSCTVARPDPKVLWDEMASKFSSTVLGGGDIIPESNEFYVVALNFAMAEEFFAYSDQLYRETDPATACCDNLLAIARDWGMYPKPAQFAEGYAKLTGQAFARLVDPIRIQAGSKNYRSTGTLPSSLNSSGVATVRFRAEEAGPDSNITAKEQGRLLTPMPGVSNIVEIFGGQFCGGDEEESCEEFRARFIARQAFKPRATHDWLVEKLLEWPCVTRVCDRAGECCVDDYQDGCPCCECVTNTGNDFYVMFDNTFDCGVAPECVLVEIQEWMFGPDGKQGRGLGQAPIGVCGQIHGLRAAYFDMDIDFNSCLTPSQVEAVEDALRGYMGTVCPSVEIVNQTLQIIIGQAIGSSVPFNIRISVDKDDEEFLELTDCDDLIPVCDVLPCLRDISVSGPTREEYPCY